MPKVQLMHCGGIIGTDSTTCSATLSSSSVSISCSLIRLLHGFLEGRSLLSWVGLAHGAETCVVCTFFFLCGFTSITTFAFSLKVARKRSACWVGVRHGAGAIPEHVELVSEKVTSLLPLFSE